MADDRRLLVRLNDHVVAPRNDFVRPLVLVVDDEPSWRLLARTLMVDAGFEVVEAATAEQCVRVLAEQRPALVILDLGLPDVDGIDLLVRLRSVAAGRALSVLVLTAREGVEHTIAALRAGADDYLSKGAIVDELAPRALALTRRRDWGPRSPHEFGGGGRHPAQGRLSADLLPGWAGARRL